MRSLSIREIRAALGNLEKIVEQEGELLITRHGKPVARVLPLERRRPLPSHKAFRAGLPVMKVSSAELVRADRDER